MTVMYSSFEIYKKLTYSWPFANETNHLVESAINDHASNKHTKSQFAVGLMEEL